ncbi:MAG: DUF72 domain-containing protein [Candidatus Acidiferrales bacterium]
MTKIYAGTSGWAYSSWKPRFYPAKLGSAKFLSYYATRLNSVEVNYSFRSLLGEKLLAEWIEATPADFKFAVKAHYTITHVKRLCGAKRLTSQFFSSLSPLREARKLGPVLFQLPPFLKCDAKLLRDFLKILPREPRSAFEFRHASWFCDEVFDILREAGVALCNAESEKLGTPDVRTADFSYLRLRKSSYSINARKTLATRIANLAKQGIVFVYFKHEETPKSALNAERLLKAVEPPE